MSTKVNVSALAALLLQLSVQGVELVDDTLSVSASSAVVVEEEFTVTPDPGIEVQHVNDDILPEHKEAPVGEVVAETSGGVVGEGSGESEVVREEVEDVVVPVDRVRETAEPLVAAGAGAKLVNKKPEKPKVVSPAGPVEAVTYAAVASGSASGSASSWADEMEEEEEKKTAVKAVVVPVVPASVSTTSVEAGAFFKEYVRVPRVRELRRILKNICGAELPRVALQDLSLASVTAAAVPPAFVDGRNRLSALARVGDAAMLLAMLMGMYRQGAPASSLQSARESRLSNCKMQTQFSACALAKYVDGATPEVLRMTKTGADACEAIAGVLQLHLGAGAVGKYMHWLGL